MKLKMFGRDKVGPLMQEMYDFISSNHMEADTYCITICREAPDVWVGVLAHTGDDVQ